MEDLDPDERNFEFNEEVTLGDDNNDHFATKYYLGSISLQIGVRMKLK
jgi:hypothetical protein